MRTVRRDRSALRAPAAALCVLAVTGCATLRPAAPDARRIEAAIESPPPATQATPRPAQRVAAPPAAPRAVAPLAASSAPQPFAQLSGTAAGAPQAILGAVDDLLFTAGSAQLDGGARARLDRFIATLGGLGDGYRLEVQGHSDDSGDEVGNLDLALRRAEAVRDHLRRRLAGAPPRIAVVALGSRYPAADNQTAAGRARNRRVVVLALR